MRIITDEIARTIVSDVDHGGGAGRCAAWLDTRAGAGSTTVWPAATASRGMI